MTTMLDERVGEARDDQAAPVPPGMPFERWVRLVAAAASNDGSDFDRTVMTIAGLIRLRVIDDPYAAARIVRSFKIGRDLEHDDAVEAIAVSIRREADRKRQA